MFKRYLSYPFFLLFSITLLLNLNFTILRSIRNTLAVADLGASASNIPFFELCGALPGSILITWCLSVLMRKIPIYKVFLTTMIFFLSFFVFFAMVLYPFLAHLRENGEISALMLRIYALLFYSICELWKPSLSIILFWGLVNQYLNFEEAKNLYPSLMLGGSLGSILSGPIISFCTHPPFFRMPSLSESWALALIFMIFIVAMLGAIAALLYYKLWLYFSNHTQGKVDIDPCHPSFKASCIFCFHHKPLRLLSWIVIADYIAYSLGEVIFLDVLKTKFSTPLDYCNYMGALSSWSGILTVLSALFMTPFILKRCRWTVAAIITPLCLLVTEGFFFIFLRGSSISSHWLGWSERQWIDVIIILGSIQYCLCRATKYTLFDSSKELAFVLMPSLQKMKGKLIIDGICARMGRGGASVLSIGLINLCRGVRASSLLTGIIAIAITLSWVLTTQKLGKHLEKESLNEPA